MNDSLAKQLHDLIFTARFKIDLEVDHQMTNVHKEINNLIEKPENTQEKPNE